MAATGKGERAVEFHVHPRDRLPGECPGELARGFHRAYGMRTRRADADLEDVEDTDLIHGTIPRVVSSL